MTLIGVKSKYGSGWGTSPGLMNNNDTPKKKSLCKVHKYSCIYMVRIRKQAHKLSLLSKILVILLINCMLNITWLMIFILPIYPYFFFSYLPLFFFSYLPLFFFTIYPLAPTFFLKYPCLFFLFTPLPHFFINL